MCSDFEALEKKFDFKASQGNKTETEKLNHFYYTDLGA